MKTEFINLERLKKPAGQKFLTKNKNKLVHIQSDHGLWGWDSCGYVSSNSRAGVYTLEEAYKATSHCGKEKCVRYWLIKDKFLTERITELHNEMSRYLSFLNPSHP